MNKAKRASDGIPNKERNLESTNPSVIVASYVLGTVMIAGIIIILMVI